MPFGRRSAIGRRNSKPHNRLRRKRNSGADGFVGADLLGNDAITFLLDRFVSGMPSAVSVCIAYPARLWLVWQAKQDLDDHANRRKYDPKNARWQEHPGD